MGIKTILIIDDEPDFCELIKESLELRGNFEVFTATGGKEGINIARKVRPNAILLDIRMPGMSGFEVLENLKKNKDTMAIPVIMLSGMDDEPSKIKAAQLFNESYITKPVEIENLEKNIESVLKRRGLAG